MTLRLIQNDTAPTLDLTVNADLNGATAVAHVRKPDRTVVTKAASIGTVEPAAPRSALSVTWAPGDLAKTGTYRVEVEVTFNDGKQQTFGTAAFFVEAEFA